MEPSSWPRPAAASPSAACPSPTTSGMMARARPPFSSTRRPVRSARCWMCTLKATLSTPPITLAAPPPPCAQTLLTAERTATPPTASTSPLPSSFPSSTSPARRSASLWTTSPWGCRRWPSFPPHWLVGRQPTAAASAWPCSSEQQRLPLAPPSTAAASAPAPACS